MKITKKATMGELMELNPELGDELAAHGMFCMGCPMARRETIEEGAIAHGIDPDALVEKLNKKLNEQENVDQDESFSSRHEKYNQLDNESEESNEEENE